MLARRWVKSMNRLIWTLTFATWTLCLLLNAQIASSALASVGTVAVATSSMHPAPLLTQDPRRAQRGILAGPPPSVGVGASRKRKAGRGPRVVGPAPFHPPPRMSKMSSSPRAGSTSSHAHGKPPPARVRSQRRKVKTPRSTLVGQCTWLGLGLGLGFRVRVRLP